VNIIEPKVVEPIEWKNGWVRFLDQRLLPHSEKWIETNDWQEIFKSIENLSIRGAPLIGIAAALAIAAEAYRVEYNLDRRSLIIKAVNSLRYARPTAVNLSWAMGKMLDTFNNSSDNDLVFDLEKCALALWQSEKRRCIQIGKFGEKIIPKDAYVLTICNTGALATGGIGTALGVVYTAVSRGKSVEVFASETRPLLQGSRLTAWELKKAGIPVTLIVDSATGWLLSQNAIDLCIIGADRIAANGDTANKIGSYPLAVLCQRHKVPFYIAAPTSTIDPDTPNGAEIPIEHRQKSEVLNFFDLYAVIDDAEVLNPAFDIVPAELITGIITDKGIFKPPYDFRSLSTI